MVQSPTGATRPARKGRRKSLADEQSVLVYRVAALLCGVLFRFWVRRYRVIGGGKLPVSGGVFLICNHSSAMDPFLLGYAVRKRMPAGPGKIELFRNRFVAHLMRKLGIFPLHQGRADTAAVKAMIELYRSERVVIVYPEGGRTQTTEMRPFVPDFARLMIRLKATVVPCAIAGAADVLPIGKVIPRRNCPVAVVIGEPLNLAELYKRSLTPELVEDATQLMHSSVARLRDQAEIERSALIILNQRNDSPR